MHHATTSAATANTAANTQRDLPTAARATGTDISIGSCL
ncbi:hypothetical protein XCR_0200 [Xanthomonas campestris pv. raphani 756C]|nr:hypothetical protein XCR_0200 [Xanthomonas campestris pv. raphani 756C]